MKLRLEMGDWFVLGITALQLCAVLSYCWKRRWAEAALYGAWMVGQLLVLYIAVQRRSP